jgi:CheY-like chemotaxis protein
MMALQTEDISILLADDHPVVRQGYRRVLESQSDFRVVAEADSAASAYSAFKQHSPHVVVLDISMPGTSGLEAIRNIRSRDGSASILVFATGTFIDLFALRKKRPRTEIARNGHGRLTGHASRFGSCRLAQSAQWASASITRHHYIRAI